jgi:endonuclease G
MRFRLRPVLLVFSIFLFLTSPTLAGPLEDCAEYAQLGVPGQDGDILCRTGHLLAHHPVRKTPIWVIERLTAEKAASTVVPREAGSFRLDPGLKKGRRAGLSDYRKSGYDRGHMAPAADMRWDEQAMIDCFYLSNMVPQVGKKMNQGIWKALEERVRKIVYDPGRQEAIAFIMPNEALETEDLPLYVVTVRDVEEKTGLDFLSNLEKELQDSIETTRADGLWQ